MTTSLVDLHCHLDLYPNLEAAISEAEDAGVYVLTVTTTPKAWPRNRELTKDLRYVRAALGLHPQLVGDRADELEIWERHLNEARYIGEVGLDASPRFYKSFDLQKRIFARVLTCCSEAGGKILTVHSVRAASPVLDLIETHLPPDRGRVVLHWFTGTKSLARRAVDLGCYFSVNAEMLRNDRHRSMILDLPMERLLTETDGPFTQIDGRPSKPADVRATVEELARARGLDADTMSAEIGANLRRLVSLT